MTLKRYLMLTAIFLNCFWISFFFYSKLREPDPVLITESHITPITINLTEEPAPLELPELVKEINEKNKKILNLVSSKMTINMSGKRFSGTLAFSKPERFSMTIRSMIIGDVINVGANDEILWYWSYSDPEEGVHWAKIEDFNKTRLKVPFDPSFLRSSLGFDELTLDSLVRISDQEKAIVLTYKAISGTNEPLQKCVVINKKHKIITRIVVLDQKGNILASSAITETAGDLPRTIYYDWPEENGQHGSHSIK